LARDHSDRDAFVATSCGDDVELLRDVVAMLAAHEEAGAFGGTPGLDDARTLVASAVSIGLTPGELFAERYRIVSLIGRGGMGEVYRANDLRVGAPVALKFLSSAPAHAKPIERFTREARLARQITHPNVCRVYDVGEWNGRLSRSLDDFRAAVLSSLQVADTRDAARLLGLSHQRVHQLTQSEAGDR
jgi:hypothetical protein